jgi:hypothetical protein
MTDDPVDRPGRRPTPWEPLWSLRAAGVSWEAELRFHGESHGWGAQLLRKGELVIGRRFDTKALAIQWAEVERLAIE